MKTKVPELVFTYDQKTVDIADEMTDLVIFLQDTFSKLLEGRLSQFICTAKRKNTLEKGRDREDIAGFREEALSLQEADVFRMDRKGLYDCLEQVFKNAIVKRLDPKKKKYSTRYFFVWIIVNQTLYFDRGMTMRGFEHIESEKAYTEENVLHWKMMKKVAEIEEMGHDDYPEFFDQLDAFLDGAASRVEKKLVTIE